MKKYHYRFRTSLTFCLLLYLFLILLFLTGGGQVSLEVHVQQIVLIELPAESRDPVVIRFIPRQLDLLTSSRPKTCINVDGVQQLRPDAGFSVTDLGCGGGRGCEEFGLVGTVIHISGSVCGLVVKRHVIRDEPAATMRYL